MEQYQMPKELDFDNLRLCIDNYPAESLFIRDCGGMREDGGYHCYGIDKVDENLRGRTLDFRKDDSGLYLMVDSDEVFHFPLKDCHKGFSLAYERFFDDGRMYFHEGIPNDPHKKGLPEPRRSFLRNIFDNHLVEIYFDGRVDIKFHSWMDEPHWKYWEVEGP